MLHEFYEYMKPVGCNAHERGTLRFTNLPKSTRRNYWGRRRQTENRIQNHSSGLLATTQHHSCRGCDAQSKLKTVRRISNLDFCPTRGVTLTGKSFPTKIKTVWRSAKLDSSPPRRVTLVGAVQNQNLKPYEWSENWALFQHEASQSWRDVLTAKIKTVRRIAKLGVCPSRSVTLMGTSLRTKLKKSTKNQ